MVAQGLPASITSAVDLLAGALLVLLGLLAAQRYPRYAAMASGAGVVWVAADVWPALALLHRPLLVLAALAYPDGRLRSPRNVVLVVASVLATLVTARPASDIGWLTVAGAVASVTWLDRGHTDGGAGGTVRTRASLAVAAALALPSAARLVGTTWPPSDALLTAYSALVALAATTLVLGVVEQRGREADAAIELGGAGPAATLTALRRDPPQPGSAAAISRQAAIALLEEHERAQQDLAERLREVRASRERLLEAEGLEQRRLRRLLDAGTFPLLDQLATSLDACVSLGDDATRTAAARCLEEVDRARDDLRRFASGIAPRVLREEGLAAALSELALDSPLAFEVRTQPGRFPSDVESAVWFVCAEAVANAGKHASAGSGRIEVWTEDSDVVARVRDDGVGGAVEHDGSGLSGLRDRVAAVGGALRVDSPRGSGTEVEVRVPCR
jgi:signal transduction histidine kinase